MKVVGLFAGIGGVERGLHQAGHETTLLCEINDGAASVLRARFPDIPLVGDIRDLGELPPADVIAAGFPCQDLSQAGRTAGIEGRESGLVGEVFRLLAAPGCSPRWVLLENVPFMLQLDRGEAMSFLTSSLERLGFGWAYRVIDTRSFGLPQRRQRVILLASRTEDPRDVLFADEAGEPEPKDHRGYACGFYWTEGTRGLGWAVDATPTLKGGSTIGIPSPPAVWMPDGRLVTPEIRDAERLQGFPSDWTKPAMRTTKRRGARWKLVGNAVSVPVAKWVGGRMREPGTHDPSRDSALNRKRSWPSAAWGMGGITMRVEISKWPVRRAHRSLAEFMRYEPKLLSARATAGFLKRARSSNLHFVEGFLDAVSDHLERMKSEVSV